MRARRSQPQTRPRSSTIFLCRCASPFRHCHVNEFSLPSSSLSPDFGAGQQARLAFRDLELLATDSCSIPRRLKLTMPSLARLRIRQDRQNAARAILAPVYGRFTEGLETGELKAAKALLDDL